MWCGYASVEPGHPLFEVGYNDLYERGIDLSVHGGITYSDKCAGHICHEPKPGAPDNLFWFGFDYAHGTDYMPAHEAKMCSYGYPTCRGPLHYWTLKEAREETEQLAEQLTAIEVDNLILESIRSA